MRNKLMLLLSALVVAMMLLAACGGGNDATPTPAPAAATEAATEAATKVENAAGAVVNQGQQAVQSFGNTVGQATQDAVSGLQSAWQWVTH